MDVLQPQTTGVLVAGVLSLSLLYWLSTRRPAGLPPGPGPALPLLGHLLLLERDTRAQFRQWRRQYGDVFSYYVGSQLVVVFNGLDVMKETFVKTADTFSHRPHAFYGDKINEGKGLFFTNGVEWKEQRTTSLEILRRLGMGKNVLADRIQEEVTHYIRAIQQHQGAPVDLQHLTQTSVSNNIMSIVFGKRFEYDDPDFKKYIHAMDDTMGSLTGSGLLNFFPQLDRLPGDFFSAKRLIANMRLVENQCLRPLIDKHVQTYSEDKTDTDYIYAYLKTLRTLQQQGKQTTHSDLNLLKNTGDLFLGGTETSSTTILWIIAYFLHFPQVQEKCYQELCDVIGTSRQPAMRDKVEMSYLEATVMETLRIANIVPYSAPYSASCDVSFRGYVIPKGAFILPNMETVLHDPAEWGDPENFRPERFIGPDGKLQKPDAYIPFGNGRRQCLGKSLATMELFLYMSNLLQQFRFLPPPDGQLPSLQGSFGITVSAKPYLVRAVPRD